MPFNASRIVTEKIESLCALGCTHVNDIIDRGNQCMDIEELEGFSKEEKQLILRALSDIMSVYTENKDQGCSD